MLDKGQLFKKDKRTFKVHWLKTNNMIQKWTKDMNTQFSKEGMQMGK